MWERNDKHQNGAIQCSESRVRGRGSQCLEGMYINQNFLQFPLRLAGDTYIMRLSN